MAKGVTKRTTWKKGDPRAAEAGRKSSRKMSVNSKNLMSIRATELRDIIFKYWDYSPKEISLLLEQNSEIHNGKETSNLPNKELMVLKYVQEVIKSGNIQMFNFLLDRSIGKVPDKLMVDDVTNKTLHEQIVDAIEE